MLQGINIMIARKADVKLLMPVSPQDPHGEFADHHNVHLISITLRHQESIVNILKSSRFMQPSILCNSALSGTYLQ